MKIPLFSLLFGASLCCASLGAQDLTAVIHDPSGTASDTTLSTSYQFPDTPVADASSIVVRFSNASASPVQIAAILVGNQAGSSQANPNFSVTGFAIGKILGVGPSASFEQVNINFTPESVGSIPGYLQVVYQIQQNGCNFSSQTPSTQCPSRTASVSTLSGNGTAAQFGLSYMSSSGPVTLQPNSASPLSFGNVSTSSTSAIRFTLTNQTGAAITAPTVSLVNQVYGSSAFVLDSSAMPASIAPGASGSFTITFAPGQTGQANAAFLLNSASYAIMGTGIALTGVDALQISFVDATGVRTSPQAATPISFGQVIAGTNVPASLKFTVTNPATSFDSVSLSPLSASGVGFSSTGAPPVPVSIAPGQSITFQLVFSPSATGTYSGTLSIGTRSFALSGASISSAVPDASLQVDLQPLTSQQQAHLSVQLASASTISAIGQLSMSFSPAVAGVADDPAVYFVATSGRQLQVTVAPGSESATFNGQPALTFQTGTTAGTLTFTLAFPNKAPITQSFTIVPAQVVISSGTAVRQNPSLVVTLTGFDNTYSAGAMAFTFYDTSGNVINAAPLSVDVTQSFHQYFFTSSKVGGAFSVQANFPVTGPVTQVGSVKVSIGNSAGTSTTTETFQ
jgi:hypothetical protein